MNYARITWRDAERVTGRRLDRRRSYAFKLGKIWILEKYTLPCCGCSESPESTPAPEKGTGCYECGYTGRRRYEVWCPLDDSLMPVPELPGENTPRPPGCQCQWEAGDSPCRVHGEDET